MRVTVICEGGVNHNGNLTTALRLCDAAKRAGADVIKFQTFLPELSIDASSPDYKLLECLALPLKSFIEIAKHCASIGIEFMSTPDDLPSLKFLVEECGMKRIKIGSGSLTYKPLLQAACNTRLPVILSTGMTNSIEIDEAVTSHNWKDLTLLHCVSLYPCPVELANLNVIQTLKVFGLPVGYSDHTLSPVAIPSAATAFGITVLEKHMTLSKRMFGPDHKMSLSPGKFEEMVTAVRDVEKALGDGSKTLSPQEAAMIPRVRKGSDGKQPGL